jgi:hypothetical protein
MSDYVLRPNRKKVVFVTLIAYFICLLITIGSEPVLIYRANNLAEKYDLTFTPIAGGKTTGKVLNEDELDKGAAPVVEYKIEMFEFRDANGKLAKIPEAEYDAFNLFNFNIKDTNRYIQAVPFFISLFSIFYFYKFNLTKFGAIVMMLGSIILAASDLLFSPLKYYVIAIFLIGAFFTITHKEVIRGKGLRFWDYWFLKQG